MNRLANVRDEVAVVGVGETDYRKDYARARNKETYQDAYGFAAEAFRQALDDCGLQRDDIDGLIAGPATASERLGEVLGIDPRWAAQADAAHAVMQGVLAIHAGLAECVALVYGNDQRTAGTAYGGPNAMGGERYLAYVYYSPWGLTSQGALYAMMANRYMHLTGMRQEDLGAFVIAQREYARLNPRAIMQTRLAMAEYLDSRLICEPLRLFDYCLINDGGVALILTTTERARRMRHKPVKISAIGRSDINSDATSLKPRLVDFYHTGHRQAAEQLYNMAGIGPSEVDVVQIYDSFSVHIPFALEGFGFCEAGEVGRLICERQLGPGGSLAINTSGGMLSESYMQGWNHQVEVVRQLRGITGERQVRNARNAQYISDVAGKVATLMYSVD